MDDFCQKFQIRPGDKTDLERLDPDAKKAGFRKKPAKKQTKALVRKMQKLQYLLYAEDRRSLLICLQAMDAGGKDGTIRHVVGPLNPQGTRVYSFKAPSEKEAAHDFLWRIHQQVPPRGEIAIFNRSHYEDVLVARVHELVPREVWSRRYDLINAFEAQLVASGTHLLKFFLHISPEEQLSRFKRRLDDPARHWKISRSDYTERALWPEYQKAYAEALTRTSTAHAPWYVIPSDRKWFRNLAVSQIITKTLESLEMKFPPPSVDLEEVRCRFHSALRKAEKTSPQA